MVEGFVLQRQDQIIQQLIRTPHERQRRIVADRHAGHGERRDRLRSREDAWSSLRSPSARQVHATPVAGSRRPKQFSAVVVTSRGRSLRQRIPDAREAKSGEISRVDRGHVVYAVMLTRPGQASVDDAAARERFATVSCGSRRRGRRWRCACSRRNRRSWPRARQT
jgi:hypothetical protein